jgi:hypothetical protein
MENGAQQSYKAAKDQVDNIMKFDDEVRKAFSHDGARKMKRAATVVEAQIEALIAGTTPPALSGEDRMMIKETVNLFSIVAIDRPITPIVRDLAGSLLLLIHNWNQATGCDEDMDKKIRMINAIISAQMTLAETIEVIQKLLEKIRKTYQYEPPAFNLSRAYLENMKKAIEEQNKTQ